VALINLSPTVAFDDASHLFVNPVAGTTYGPNFPTGAATPTPTPTPAVGASAAASAGTDFIYTIPSTNATIDLTQLWANYWWVLLGAGAVFLMTRRRR